MNILLAVDGSKYSHRAARLLARLPFKEELKITVLHAVDLAALTQPAELSPLAAIKYGQLMRREIPNGSPPAGHARRVWWCAVTPPSRSLPGPNGRGRT